MKKTILLFLAFTGTYLHSQSCGGPSLINESFSNGIPANWTVIDYDNNPMTYSDSAKGFTGQFQPHEHLGKKCVACCSNNSGMADDYIITPSLSLGNGPICLSWKASALIPPYYNESYEVRISTTTPDANGFNAHPVLISFPSELGPWTEHSLDLSAYAGQTVCIGFRYTAIGYAFFLDDICVSSPVAVDASVTSVKLSPVVAAGTYPLSGELLNAGTSTITSMNLKWQVASGPVNSMLLSSLSIAPGSYYSFSHSIPWTPSSIGTYMIKIWADNLNGNPDQYLANDTLKQIIYVNTVPRKVLLEGFTNDDCPGCNPSFVYVDSIINPYLAAGLATNIQYHCSWPGPDPMYAYAPDFPMTRVSYYGISSIAHAVLEGEDMKNDCGQFIGVPDCLDHYDLDTAQAIPTIFDIQITNSIAGNNMNVQVAVTSHANLAFMHYKLYTVMVEDSVGYLTPPGTNGESIFYHVARAMLPDSAGTQLPLMPYNQTMTYNFVYPLDPQNVATNELKIVAFIQDDSTRQVFQSQVAPPYPYVALGMNGHSLDGLVKIFPNPATNELTIHSEINTEAKTNWSIVNPLGQSVLSGTYANGGKDHTINIDQLSPGIYFLVLDSGNKFTAQKFVKQ